LHREGVVGLVLEAGHGAALVVVAHPALERGVSAGGGVGQGALEGFRIDGRGAEDEHGQPPATGGMNTRLSPSRRGASQSRNSSLMTTRSMSGPRENPWRVRNSS